jgi:Mrp family chromosome partitioning ATPase
MSQAAAARSPRNIAALPRVSDSVARTMSDEYRRAESLLPRKLIEGCRRAARRLTVPEGGSLGITSAIRGEGRSSVAAGLGLVHWLDYEYRTVIVDLDLPKPSLHRRFGLAEGPGVNELLDHPTKVEDDLQRIAGDVWLLAAGSTRDDVPRALTRFATSSIMSQLTEWAQLIILDLPPTTSTPASVEAARLCSSSVLVVRAGRTSIGQVRAAAEMLGTEPSVILNGAHSPVPRWVRRLTGD